MRGTKRLFFITRGGGGPRHSLNGLHSFLTFPYNPHLENVRKFDNDRTSGLGQL